MNLTATESTPLLPKSGCPTLGRVAVAIGLILCVLIGTPRFIHDVSLCRATTVAGIVLVLWLTEVIPLFATTFVLWVAIVLTLGQSNPQAFGLNRVLSTAASPILALFLGGFALSVAGAKYGIDTYIAWWMVKVSRGDRRMLLAAIMLGTAVLSMWMSNIAAAAMMVATLKPLFSHDTQKDAPGFRTALLLGIAFAADFGGMGTPIGTGPNLIAIGELSSRYPVTFLHWMTFGVPIVLGMVALTYALLILLHRVNGVLSIAMNKPARLTRSGWMVVTIFLLAVAGWVLESWHGIPAAVVALIVTAALFASRLLDSSDLARIEWNTLLLVAGGLSFGHLVEASGLAHAFAGSVDWDALHPSAMLFGLLVGCAILSALASNTAAAALVIPIAMSIRPEPSMAILVALAASMGVPFVFSTPPNSLAYGQGGFVSRELFIPGLLLMLIGCAILTVLGPLALRSLGVP